MYFSAFSVQKLEPELSVCVVSSGGGGVSRESPEALLIRCAPLTRKHVGLLERHPGWVIDLALRLKPL